MTGRPWEVLAAGMERLYEQSGLLEELAAALPAAWREPPNHYRTKVTEDDPAHERADEAMRLTYPLIPANSNGSTTVK
jgi:hypothetical protein